METKFKLLVVEDEVSICTGLVDVFVFHGYEVEYCHRGDEGLTKAISGQYDLILLDVMLPGVDGFEICRQVRVVDKEQPIIMLTAKNQDEDVINGLSLGADDYIAKPFSVAQLVLRVQAVLRRANPQKSEGNSLRVGDLKIDTRNLNSQRGTDKIEFTRREVDLLEYLIKNQHRPVPRAELLNKVWGYNRDSEIETRTVDIHIAKLRRKIEVDSQNPRLLVTIRGEGYKMVSSE